MPLYMSNWLNNLHFHADNYIGESSENNIFFLQFICWPPFYGNFEKPL